MKTLTICVGSACHMKGSHRVIDKFDELIAKYGLEDEVELKASFCMDQCTGNIGARVDEIVYQIKIKGEAGTPGRC